MKANNYSLKIADLTEAQLAELVTSLKQDEEFDPDAWWDYQGEYLPLLGGNRLSLAAIYHVNDLVAATASA